MPVALTVDAAGVATLTLDRPAKRNALDQAMLEALAARVDELAGRPEVRAVVLRGSGGVFCAGADIGDWVSPSAAQAARLARLGREVFTGLARLPVPSVAVIDGPAVGGGFELALACDLRIGEQDAMVGFPELRLGNLPSWGGLARMVDIAGLGVARFLLLTGELVSCARAAELQLVTTVCRHDELDAVVDRTVGWLTAGEPYAVALAKTVLSGFEHDHRLEPVLASHTAALPSSRQRKQQFLDRRTTPVPTAPAPTPKEHP